MQVNHQILFAGFGGQGILFTGKFFVYLGMMAGHEVSWLPSYGPEMRGGTANCSVIISDTPVGSPIVLNPTILVAMNLPSYDKFEPEALTGAKIFVDSSLIERPPARSDVETFAIPVTKLSYEENLEGLANMIMAGKVIRETGIATREEVEKAMGKVVSERKQDLFKHNLRAIDLGYNYQ